MFVIFKEDCENIGPFQISDSNPRVLQPEPKVLTCTVTFKSRALAALILHHVSDLQLGNNLTICDLWQLSFLILIFK